MYEIIIIGAGPAGISMAVEARNDGIDSSKIILIEKADEHSFTILKYYPDTKSTRIVFIRRFNCRDQRRFDYLGI